MAPSHRRLWRSLRRVSFVLRRIRRTLVRIHQTLRRLRASGRWIKGIPRGTSKTPRRTPRCQSWPLLSIFDPASRPPLQKETQQYGSKTLRRLLPSRFHRHALARIAGRGWGGIRTPGSFWEHTLSRRAQSTALSPIRKGAGRRRVTHLPRRSSRRVGKSLSRPPLGRHFPCLPSALSRQTTRARSRRRGPGVSEA